MARPSKPAELKEAQGNPGKRKVVVAPQSAAPVLDMPPPETLRRGAWPIWIELVRVLKEMKLFRVSDRYALEVYCDAVHDFHRATKALATRGDFYKTESNHGTMLRTHPMHGVKDRAIRRMEKYEPQFGLTPRARQELLFKLAVTPAQPDLPGTPAQPSPANANTSDATGGEPAPTSAADDTGPTAFLLN